jgi:hypothetical protein
MGLNRLFISQGKLDEWLSDDRVEIDGEVLKTRTEQRRFVLRTALLFTEEVTGTPDPHGLLGKVKDLEQLKKLGGEYASGSVVLGDNAYTVIEGFVGAPILEGRPAHSGDTLAAAMRSATGDPRKQSGEMDLLARFFLQTRS